MCICGGGGPHLDSTRFVDFDQAAAIIEIRRLANAGLPEREIADRIGWHVVDVYRSLADSL